MKCRFQDENGHRFVLKIKRSLELLTSNIQLINLRLFVIFFLKVLVSPQRRMLYLYFGHKKEFLYKFLAELGSQKSNIPSIKIE